MKFFKYTLTFVLSIFIFTCDKNVNTENLGELEFEINLIELDSNRIKNDLLKLASFGNTELDGNERIAYSDYNVDALAWLKAELEALNLNVSIDFAGNLIAVRDGKTIT